MLRYDLHLAGESRGETSRERLLVNLIYHLRLPPQRARRLLPPATGVLKRGLAPDEAQRWLARLERAGLGARLERQSQPWPSRDLELQARLAVLRPDDLPPPSFSLGQRLALLGRTLVSAALPLLYLLPTLLALLATAGTACLLLELLPHHPTAALGIALPALLVSGGLSGIGLTTLLGARRPEATSLALRDCDEPELRELLTRLGQALGVRPPRHLRVTLETDFQLAAGGRELRLGLPLLTVLDRQQALAYIGHLLGHRVFWLDRLSGVLLVPALGWLEHQASQPGRRGTRRLGRPFRQWAHCLLTFGRTLTQAASQAREGRADHYEALLGGSAAFADTAQRRRQLARTWREALRLGRRTVADGRCVDDLTELLDALQRQEPPARTTVGGASRPWAEHPADRQRLAWVAQQDRPALLTDDRPARGLLRGAAHYGRRLTYDEYIRRGHPGPGAQTVAAATLLTPRPHTDLEHRLQAWSGQEWPQTPWLPLHSPLERALRELSQDALGEHLRADAAGFAQAWQEAEREGQRRGLLALCEELHSHELAHRLRGDGPLGTQYLAQYRAIDTWQTPARQRLYSGAARYRLLFERALAVPRAGQAEAQAAYGLLVYLGERYAEFEGLREARLVLKEYRALRRQRPEQAIIALTEFAQQDHSERVRRWLASSQPLPPTLFAGSLAQYLAQRCPALAVADASPSELYRHGQGLIDALNLLHRQALVALVDWCRQDPSGAAAPFSSASTP